MPLNPSAETEYAANEIALTFNMLLHVNWGNRTQHFIYINYSL